MIRLYYDLTGKPAVFLANSLRYYNGLCGLSIYRNPPEQAVSLVRLKGAIEAYESRLEGAINYDRLQISLRNQERKNLTDLFKRILSYLQMIATPEDVPALQQAGIEVRGQNAKKRTTTAPAAS